MAQAYFRGFVYLFNFTMKIICEKAGFVYIGQVHLAKWSTNVQGKSDYTLKKNIYLKGIYADNEVVYCDKYLLFILLQIYVYNKSDYTGGNIWYYYIVSFLERTFFSVYIKFIVTLFEPLKNNLSWLPLTFCKSTCCNDHI